MDDENYIHSSWTNQDVPFETPLRPLSLDDFTGQESVKERLAVLIGAAKQRGEALGHCLFNGPPGLGKTTLAHIIAKAMGTQCVVSSGPVLEKAGDLAGILTNLKEGDVFFIDEIHRLSRAVEEYLYSAMEDFSLDLLIDSGPAARSVQVKLHRFTLVGATTRVGLLSSPLRSRFALNLRLDYYAPEVLEQIILRSAKILKVALDKEAAEAIALRARGTPRIANNLLRWVRDYAQIHRNDLKNRNFGKEAPQNFDSERATIADRQGASENQNCEVKPTRPKTDSAGHFGVQGSTRIDAKTAAAALDMLHIDHLGLDEMDKKILQVMIAHYQGGPVGISTLAAALAEEAHTLEEVHEPFLIMQGFIKRTPRGRVATPLAYAHLKNSHGVPL